MKNKSPLPGDLLLVEESEWYAVNSGETVRVCEYPGWAIRGRDIYVAPREKVGSFWGPSSVPPDGKKSEHMSTSGGPFMTVTLVLVPEPEFIEFTTDEFWHWADFPRASGGVNYRREVSRFRLSLLPDSPWIDPELERRFVWGVSEKGPMRLACSQCGREDFDGVYQLPSNWADIGFVQWLAKSKQEIDGAEPRNGSVTEWYTHLGTCPECLAADELGGMDLEDGA